jgi:hypothetical protein
LYLEFYRLHEYVPKKAGYAQMIRITPITDHNGKGYSVHERIEDDLCAGFVSSITLETFEDFDVYKLDAIVFIAVDRISFHRSLSPSVKRLVFSDKHQTGNPAGNGKHTFQCRADKSLLARSARSPAARAIDTARRTTMQAARRARR